MPSKRKTNNPKSICFAFNREGGCLRGDGCKFLHEKGDVPSEEEVAARRAEKIAAKSAGKTERQAAHLEREAMREEGGQDCSSEAVGRAGRREKRLVAFKEREVAKRRMMEHVDAILLSVMDTEFDRAIVTFTTLLPFEHQGNLDVHLNADTGTVVFETMPREALSEELCRGVFASLCVRTFSRTATVPGKKCCCHERAVPLKRIYSFAIRKEGFSRLPQAENQEAQCTDYLTGRSLPPETGVEYC
jgi:hypothetical protein